MSRAIALALVLTLAGCAAGGRYPSLARRPEELGLAGTPSAPASPAAGSPVAASSAAADDDAADAARTAQLLAQARAGHRAFADGSAAVARDVARAGPRGSDSWAQASVAVSAAEARLSAASSALADLDALAVARRVALAGGSDATLTAIAAAQDEVGGYTSADGAMLHDWTQRLGG